MIEFEAWPKTPRLSAGGVTITEKIDGTNAAVIIMPENTKWDEFHAEPRLSNAVSRMWVPDKDQVYLIGAQSRKRLIFPGEDNAGFAAWVQWNAGELLDLLGPGRHFGEWWGQGIQRRYGMDRKVFSLFNTHKWHKIAAERDDWWERARNINMDTVPLMHVGKFSDYFIQSALDDLRNNGSYAAASWGFAGQRAEGIILHHASLSGNLKVLLENDDISKSEVQRRALAPLDSDIVRKAKEILEG